MKLTDIVTEQQLDELDAASIGRGIGSVAKGVGAVASIPQGIGRAVKKGYQSGLNTISGDAPTSDSGVEKPSGGFMSSFKAGLKGKGPTVGAQDASIDGTLNVQQLAKLMPGIDAAALAKAVAVVKAGGNPSVSQQQALSNAFIGLLQADPQATTQAMSLLKKVSSEPAQSKPVAQNTAATKEPAADATQAAAPQTPDQIKAAKQATAGQAARDQMAGNTAKSTGNYDGTTGAPVSDKAKADAAFDASPEGKALQAKVDAMGTTPTDPGAAAFGQMANTLTKEPAAGNTPTPTTTPTPPTSQSTGGKLTAAQQAAMKAKLQGQRQAGKTAGTTASGFNKYTKDASSQRIVGANPDGSPKIQQIKASKINTGNNLSEMLAANIAKQKKKIAEERAVVYENSSIFTK